VPARAGTCGVRLVQAASGAVPAAAGPAACHDPRVRHTYECQLRWADMDLLGHVNNVVYVDYLQEARIDMLLTHAPDPAAGDLAEGVVVVRHQVRYASPLTFRLQPVTIDVWITEVRAASFTMAYEVYDVLPDGTRRTYLEATSLLTPYVFADERPRRITAEERAVLERFLEPSPSRPALALAAPADDAPQLTGRFPLQVRFSDVDSYRHVNNVKYFEYFQEARVAFMMRLWEGIVPGTQEVPMVLAQCDVDYLVPILFRPEAYDVRSWVSRVGNSSFVIDSEVRDGDQVLARARVVMVTFDPETQRAAPSPPEYRELLMRHVVPA